MRVKNTQGQKQFHNVFFVSIFLIGKMCFGVVNALGVFLGIKTKKVFQNTGDKKIIDFLVRFWPKNFNRKPSAYKATRFLGDFIHHIFLKK